MAGTHRNLLVGDWKEDNSPNTGITKGVYDLADWGLCQSTAFKRCRYDGVSTPYLMDNNTITVFIREGDALTFVANLVDYDEWSDHDRVCHGEGMTQSMSLDDWDHPNEFEISFGTGPTDSGRCSFTVIVSTSNNHP